MKLWISLPIDDFIDVLSICNISVLIMDSLLHGYYIHGQSPGGVSDTSITALKMNL